jgi:uncharacterized repeat protein (TIGR03803 family)
VIRPRFAFTLVLAVVVATSHPSPAQTYSVLYSFGSATGDGIGPSGALTQDAAGNFYGITQVGGNSSVGTVFSLTPAGLETVLYDFNLRPDAMLPVFGLIRDSAGNLYGTTPAGGTYGANNGDGAVFKLDAAGNETVLHSFGKGKDGVIPNGPLIRDAKGYLYGETISGGRYGAGTLFRISPPGAEKILYSFTGPDGANPSGGLIQDADGNLYGTAWGGGANGFGIVFQFTPAGAFTVLYNFCSAVHCTDGGQPMAGLVQDSFGTLYGTTVNGGAQNQGTVFRLTKTGKEVVLHSFGEANGDGYFPMAGLVRDKAGNLYGTTSVGGAFRCGTVFKVSAARKETVLHSFCAQPDCADGTSPGFGNLFRDEAGDLYGVAGGGAYQEGVVFKLAP